MEPLRPDGDSLSVVKARHSIFYETPLAYLLWPADAALQMMRRNMGARIIGSEQLRRPSS